MRDAVIVSTARTGMGKAYKGAFNSTPGATLGAYALKPAIERAGIDPGEVDDVLWGAALQQGAQAGNLGRQVALRAPHVPPRELDLPAAPAASVCKQAEGVAPRRQVGGQRGGGGRFFAGSRRRWRWLVARRAVEAAPRLAARAQKRVG